MADSLERLESYRGRNRVLLIFAPSHTHRGYLTQRVLLEGVEDGFRERDLLAFCMFFDGGGDEHALRDRFGIASDTFAVILIGKDGGEKGRFLGPLEPATLFAFIDRMPMRRRELKEA